MHDIDRTSIDLLLAIIIFLVILVSIICMLAK